MEKPIWQSKTIYAGLIIAVCGILQAGGWFEIPYELIYTLAGAFGIYGLRDAIGKNK